MKGENLQLRILYLAKLSFRFDRQIKSFTDKQKLKKFSTIKPALQEMLNGTSLSEKENATVRNMKIIKGKFKW